MFLLSPYRFTQGDSGGPLVVWYGDRPFLTGLSSFGPKFCNGAVPDKYTRASTYASWIQANAR